MTGSQHCVGEYLVFRLRFRRGQAPRRGQGTLSGALPHPCQPDISRSKGEAEHDMG